MNEHLHVGEQFFRIIDEFENAPPDCRQTASGAALDAYRCPSGQWTIGDGCCFWENGEPVQEGDTIPDGPDVEERLASLLAYNARYCEEYVKKWVTVPLNQHQFDALCDFRFNTRETTLRNSSRLLPAINNQEWQKAALAMTEFVYGLSTHNGKPYQEAMEGLLRRRLWDALIFLSYDPVGAVTVKGTALPTTIKLMSSGVYRDVISSEGLTTLNQVRMRANPLPPPQLEPSPRAAAVEAAQRQPDPARSSAAAGAAPPIAKPSASGSSEAAPVKPTVPAPQPPTARPAPAPVVLPSQVPKPPEKPIVIAQERINPNALPTNADTAKNMADSTRMLGMVLVAIGSVIQVVTVRLGIGTAIGAVFFDLSRDPVVITLAVTAIVAALGWVTKRNGKKTFVKGADKAQGNLY